MTSRSSRPVDCPACCGSMPPAARNKYVSGARPLGSVHRMLRAASGMPRPGFACLGPRRWSNLIWGCPRQPEFSPAELAVLMGHQPPTPAPQSWVAGGFNCGWRRSRTLRSIFLSHYFARLSFRLPLFHYTGAPVPLACRLAGPPSLLSRVKPPQKIFSYRYNPLTKNFSLPALRFASALDTFGRRTGCGSKKGGVYNEESFSQSG